MSVTSAKWASQNRLTIVAVINGQTLFVPDDLENKERQAIANWEAAGNVIGVAHWADDLTRDETASEGLRLALRAGEEQSARARSKYEPGEIASWDKQAKEARLVTDENDRRILAGLPVLESDLLAVLEADALLPDLAADRGWSLLAIAKHVRGKEATYQAIVRETSKLRVLTERAPTETVPVTGALVYPDAASLGARIDQLIADCKTAVDAILAPPV